MKPLSILSLFVFLFLFGFKGVAQFECGYSEQDRTVLPNGNVTYGGVFTPKGDLRVLLVFVSYGEPYDNNSVANWPSNQEFPDWYYATRQPFYTAFSQFSQNVYADTNRMSVSNFFYQMSNGQLRVVVDCYPRRVRVPVTQNDTWRSIHRKVLDTIKDSVNWSLYDRRTNHPDYQYDNSNSAPDGIIDYIVFCHRFNSAMNDSLPCNLDYSTANGLNTTYLGVYTMPGTGYSVTNDGYTQITGGEGVIGTFPHEVGHTLYDAPHYGGGNGVAGDYFYMPTAGWGIMNRQHNRNCALGWERYILDWIPQITASGVASDISMVTDLEATNGEFVLRDFITTGDAVRVKIPTEDGTYQYLWIENHCGYSTFDAYVGGNTFCNTPIEEYHNGLVAYVESYSHVKETSLISLYYNANGIRWLSADGNHDFTFSDIPVSVQQLCGQNTYRFWRQVANPIGGQNVGEIIRGDFDGNDTIGYINNRSSTSNEGYEVVILDDSHATADYFNGRGSTFGIGSKAGISHNPCVMNIPKYNKTLSRMGAYYMNGVSFEVLQQYQDGSIRVKVRLDDVSIDNDVRWTGTEMLLTNITGDSRPDVDIKPYHKVTIDLSGTPNRHTPRTLGMTTDFVNPTTFVCKNGSFFRLQPNAQLEVSRQSALVLEAGSVLEVGDDAVLKVKAGGALYLRSGSTLHILGRGHVEVYGMICAEYGATVVFDNELSAINLRPGWSQGTNAAVEDIYGTCNCAGIAMQPNVPYGVHEFSNDRYIQNQTFSNRKYVNGRNVFVGNHVNPNLPFGDVIINAGGDVIIDGQDDVFLNEGFEVKLGARFEVR